REHAAGGHHLDEVSASLDLSPHRLAHLIRAICLAPDEVSVAACHRHHAAGRTNPGPLDQTLIDGFRDLQSDLAGSAAVAHGGNASPQGQPCVPDSADCGDGNAVVYDLRVEVGCPVVAEVGVAVDQPWQQGEPGALHDQAVAGSRRVTGRADPGDA